ncbi:MAG: hypothetical protein WAU69_08580, partial [Solirubrobacteraceae bacterium]
MSEMLSMHDADTSAVGRGGAAGHAADTRETRGTARFEVATDGRSALEVVGLRVQFPGERGVVRAASNV